MADSPVDRKRNFRLLRDEKLPVSIAVPNRKCHTPDGTSPQRFYLPPHSPVLEVKSKFTFGSSNECLPNKAAAPAEKAISEAGEDDDGRLVRTSSFLSNPNSYRFLQDADNLPKPLAFGRSRRMSRSLPELRDLQFVSVLPDVEEEESESSEVEGEEVVYVKPTRIPWHRKLDFLWCSACQALGLANIWRFPYYCYSNGGGSFVLPYVVFMLVCSIPLLCMELAVGQVTQSGPISAFGQLCPLMKGIGVSSMMISFWLTAYYSVLTAWTVFYVFNSFYSPPRWTRCTNTWNTDDCHDVNRPVPQNLLNGDSQGTTSSDSFVMNASSLVSVDNATQVYPLYSSINVSYPADEFFQFKFDLEISAIFQCSPFRDLKFFRSGPAKVYVHYLVVFGPVPPSFLGLGSVCFFFDVPFFGLDSEIKLMATLISALKEAYTYYIKQRFQGHSLFLAVICGFCFFASIPYLTQAGIFFFQLTDYYIAVIATIIVAVFEVCTLSWIYGARNLSTCIQQMTGKTTSYFYQFCWIILTPVTILATLIYSTTSSSSIEIKKDYEYPQWAYIMGWVLFALTLCWIPFLAIAAFRKAPKMHVISRLRTTIQPRLRSQSEAMWEPKPVIILNGSTVTASEFPDYKLPELLPTVPNAVQSYVEKHSKIHQNAETMF
ncbi:Sodium- and chloride-dependent GABA transporter like protein [Argiope bruennichi]|uniref:Transporter n=1 Tax=Argiope bruennichi TaxID=94029 RepID=A0A8T0FCS2_ARGBR|nr:Sodium- and chloride-dependent GABA transporter like protein [Argiope bruennichi]